MSSESDTPRRSVEQVNRMLRSIVEAETLEHFFWLSGRTERVFKSDRGHLYFELVDDRTRIRCMLREEQSGNIDFEPRNLQNVDVYGDVHFYEGRAEAQINVVNIRHIKSAVDATPAIERLRADGVYPPARKAAPAEIRRIGIITSRSSRAIGDFETAYQSAGQRSVLAPLVWQYVLLEGDRAAQSIVDGINRLDANPEVDVIAIIRGGGRNESLAVFNDIDVLRAIISSNHYVVTGIGHHRDKTLADDVSDYVASTPTAAAHYLAQLCAGQKAASDTTQIAAGTVASAPMPIGLRALFIALTVISVLSVALLIYVLLTAA